MEGEGYFFDDKKILMPFLHRKNKNTFSISLLAWLLLFKNISTSSIIINTDSGHIANVILHINNILRKTLKNIVFGHNIYWGNDEVG